MVKIKRALISVYDKTGLDEFVKGLKDLGIEIISTGGTAEFIKSQDIPVKSISDLTGFPEILDGRVKTLHPKVHGALLSLRESHAHMQEARTHGIELIDMVVVNLYPFKQVIDKENTGIGEALENIDIGGPTILRSAAKNFRSVAVVSCPSQYSFLLEEMKAHRALLSDETLSVLAVEAFALTSEYDKAINAYLGRRFLPRETRDEGRETKDEGRETKEERREITDAPIISRPSSIVPSPSFIVPHPSSIVSPPSSIVSHPSSLEPQPPPTEPSIFPEIFNINLKKSEDLRYGENPHQKAAFYKDENIKELSISSAKQLHGKTLSFNNILDLDAALEVIKEFDKPAASIIKHTNPCGVATADTLTKAYTDAFECDKMSAYGSIVGLNKVVDINTAEAIISSGFIECIIAPGYESMALERLKTKPNMRLLEIAPLSDKKDTSEYSIKKVVGGLLVQERDLKDLDRTQLRIVTKKKPQAEEVESLLFAWKVAKYVKSNAIVLAKNTRTVGIGAGQMSRVDSVYIATYKAGKFAKASALASDAFFPKTDGVEIAARSGVTAVIQPGGSKADEEVIAVADRYGLSMVFTGMRHFRH